MQENKLKELALKFEKIEVNLQTMQALVDGENYAGVSQALPVFMSTVEEFGKELKEAAGEKKIKKAPVKKVKAKAEPKPDEEPVEEEEDEAEE